MGRFLIWASLIAGIAVLLFCGNDIYGFATRGGAGTIFGDGPLALGWFCVFVPGALLVTDALYLLRLGLGNFIAWYGKYNIGNMSPIFPIQRAS